MLKAVLFDLDGTLLPVDTDEFVEAYFELLTKKLVPFGYEKNDFIKTIWSGVKAMTYNDGTKSNKDAFWEAYEAKYGKDIIEKHTPVFNDFYVNEFKQIKNYCKPNPKAKEIIEELKKMGLKVILATNPLFPLSGLITRTEFIDLNENDFDYITSYENSSFAKPNPKYFEEILKKNGFKKDEVIMFGNNEIEDGSGAIGSGIKTYMVGDYIIKDKENRNKFEYLKFDDIILKVKEMYKEL